MNRIHSFTLLLLILFTATGSVLLHVKSRNTPSEEDIYVRQAFTKLTGLPDISVYTESQAARFRSLTDAGSIYSIGPFSPETGFSAAVYSKADRKR